VRRLADVGLFYLAQQLLNLRALLLIPVIATLLGVGAYGTLVLAWHAVTFALIVSVLAFPQGLVRLLSARPDRPAAAATLSTLGLFVLVPWALMAAALITLADGRSADG
jgi:O-antigen/teichoic acid export membrane protein